MLELITVIVFCWLFLKAVGLAFKVAWGGAKLIAAVLFAVALPLFFGCLLFAGGLLLLIPIALMGIAFALLKAVV